MSAAFDPELVEQAARVICHPHHHAIAAGRFACYLCEPRILAVLRVVADPLRAEGASDTLLAETSAYQRGKVDGAREVGAAVEYAHPASPLAAAREAVARIEADS